ncbi:YhcN/YlaJ family sporulation lipoprotein [Alteribacillus sp. JSM 102045]|uniref:YhcN/YlaJ family sporulation lipoprotein n=1 Tax=Alteribacillus sp. JSM 102045 TaxID=1562101 RepID=UPI0035C1CA5D
MKTITFLLLIMLTFGFGSGCAENQGEQDNELTKIHSTKSVDQSLSNQAKESVIEKDEVTDVKAVNTENDLLVAAKVGHFERFRIKSIEEKVTADLEKKYPNKNVYVSTDQKIIWETEKLENKLQEDKINRKKLKKEIQRINDLMNKKT